MKNRKHKFLHIKDLNYKNKYSLFYDASYKFTNCGVSNSLLNVFLECPMKFFLKINCVELINYQNKAVQFGSEIHKCLELLYKKGEINYKDLVKELAIKNYNENLVGRVFGMLKA